MINRQNLTNLTSKEFYSKDVYFKAYQKSFKDGEYNFQTPVSTPFGQTIRSYFSGGITGIAPAVIPRVGDLTFTDRQTGTKITALEAIGRIGAVQNPYLLAADILEVAPNERGIVLENLVVKLLDKEPGSQEVRKGVAEIDDAHQVAPGKLGPRNPDGTYTSTHEPKEIQEKARKMPSFTSSQRRNLMRYGLAGSKEHRDHENESAASLPRNTALHIRIDDHKISVDMAMHEKPMSDISKGILRDEKRFYEDVLSDLRHAQSHGSIDALNQKWDVHVAEPEREISIGEVPILIAETEALIAKITDGLEVADVERSGRGMEERVRQFAWVKSDQEDIILGRIQIMAQGIIDTYRGQVPDAIPRSAANALDCISADQMDTSGAIKEIGLAANEMRKLLSLAAPSSMDAEFRERLEITVKLMQDIESAWAKETLVRALRDEFNIEVISDSDTLKRELYCFVN